MAQKYLLPMAQCVDTGERIKTQDLTGARFTLNQRALAEDLASQVAARMTQRTNRLWIPLVEQYTPSRRQDG